MIIGQERETCDKTDTKKQTTSKVTVDTKHNIINNSTLQSVKRHEPPYMRNPERIFFGCGWGGYEGEGDECDTSWITFQGVLVGSSLHPLTVQGGPEVTNMKLLP